MTTFNGPKCIGVKANECIKTSKSESRVRCLSEQAQSGNRRKTGIKLPSAAAKWFEGEEVASEVLTTKH